MKKSKQHMTNSQIFLSAKTNEKAASNVSVAVLSAFPPALLAAMFFVAFLDCATPVAIVVMMVSSIVTACAFSLTGRLFARVRSYMAVIFCGVFCSCLCLALIIPDARVGFFSFANVVIAHYNVEFNSYIGLLSDGVMGCSSITFSVLFGIFIGAISWIITRLRRTGISLLFVVCLGSFSLRLSLGASGIASVLGIAAWLIQCRFTQLKNAQYSLKRLVWVIAVFVCGNLALFLLCFAFYRPLVPVSSADAWINDTSQEIRYGSDSLPQGNLGKATRMNSDDTSGLVVTVDGSLSDDLLLRGFVGANFDGLQWNALDYTAYEGDWKGVFTWLSNQGFVSSEQRAEFDSEQSSELGKDEPAIVNVSVDASQANSEYLYIPSTLRSIDTTFRMDLDSIIPSGFIGKRSYDFTIDNLGKDEILADTSWLSESDSNYAQLERVYAAFAQEHYLDISEEDKEAITEYIFNPQSWDSSAATSDYAVISRVRTMLTTLASYTDAPESYSQDESFVRWFLGDVREGNSAYFATVATLAFRSQGIPARYVEGYRVSSEDASAAWNQDKPLSLIGTNGEHAWCEVYLDGLGWTPMEVSPGFYSQAIEADSVIEVSEAYSNGSKDVSTGNESVTGLEEDDEQESNNNTPAIVSFMELLILVILAIVIVGIVVLFVQRFVRIKKRNKLTQSNNHAVCVPALYNYLADILEMSECGFNAQKPLDCVGLFVKEFTNIDVLEYKRVIGIYQSYIYGNRTLKPNELRTLRRFNSRLYEELSKPEKVKKRLYCYFVKVL